MRKVEGDDDSSQQGEQVKGGEMGRMQVNNSLGEHVRDAIKQAGQVWKQVQLVKYIRDTGQPNVYGARIPLQTNWNVALLKQLVTSTSDREVVEFLTFGWPLNHDGREVTITLRNHASAEQYPQHMQKYISKEKDYGCLLGPFLVPPWEKQVAVSPMSTRLKKGETDSRRIIMDLSWPRNGKAVNDGIPKDKYLEQSVNLIYPTVDHLCKAAYKIGRTCKGYRKDMLRAFKQIPMCPMSWPLLGICWEGLIYFDKTAMMGSRSAPYICQRTTNVIRHII